MADLNSATFTGRVGVKGETKLVGQKQIPMTTFVLINQTQSSSGQYKKTQEIVVKVWGQLGQNICDQLEVNTPVGVTGELVYNQWNGNTSWELNAKSITLFDTYVQQKENEEIEF